MITIPKAPRTPKAPRIPKVQLVTALSLITLLSGCATNDELFAKYDKTCDVPKGKVRVVEKVTFKDKIVYKDKIIYKNTTTGIAVKPWEPAVYFGFDLSSLEAKEAQRLAVDAKILKDNPQFKVNIQSFTDTKGSTAYNKKLALRRQATVVNYLTTMGIARNRITVSPLGEELPLLGSTEAERAINRRVELMLLDATGKPLPLKIQ